MAGLVPFNRNKFGLRTTGFEDFYNMLDDFFSDTWSPRNIGGFKIDVRENEKEYKIDAELPGVGKEEINLEMNDGHLLIKVDHEENKNEEKENYIHKERRFSSMQRSVYLAAAKGDGIGARLEDGVLKITVPKEEKKENLRRIEIE